MMLAGEIMAWLSKLPINEPVAIDEGGLALVCVNDETHTLEVGGTPDSDETGENQWD